MSRLDMYWRAPFRLSRLVHVASMIRNITVDCERPWELAQFGVSILARPVHPENEPGDDEVGLVLEQVG
ncbi:MAG: hypothetical protein ACR2FF_02665 [Mycobacteriales bacterium]